MSIDPADLRAHGIKGKKKLAELLDCYRRYLDEANAADRPLILRRIQAIVAVTGQARYHDLGAIPDEWFKQDSTSYLRIAYVMDRLGLDTTGYRQEIRKILPRLNDAMQSRGPDQQRTFHNYYRYFDLPEPFPLDHALEKGLIARRADCAAMSWMDVYGLTHEIFALYQYGDTLDVTPFTADEKAYLLGGLAELARRYIGERNPDLVAELVLCLGYLRMEYCPEYRKGIAYLLDSQNATGTWGDYEMSRPILGDYVNQAYYLHTTMVATDALLSAFHTSAARHADENKTDK